MTTNFLFTVDMLFSLISFFIMLMFVYLQKLLHWLITYSFKANPSFLPLLYIYEIVLSFFFTSVSFVLFSRKNIQQISLLHNIYNIHIAIFICLKHRQLTLLIYIPNPQYIFTRSRSAANFFFEASHINLFFRLKLGNALFWRSSSSSSQSSVFN